MLWKLWRKTAAIWNKVFKKAERKVAKSEFFLEGML
jgi:hypothetical protein